MKGGINQRHTLLAISAAIVCLSFSPAARADEVTDWNRQLQQGLLAANSSAFVSSRTSAIVHAAVFDAVNGIERRYAPIHVTAAAPRGASRRAAAVQAAYATLIRLLPAVQHPGLDAARESSLAAIASVEAAEHSQSIARGIEWGQQVADAILLWRSADGFTPPPPPFLGGLAVGQWRPTTPGTSGVGVQFATMTPWAIPSPVALLRPPGPPALTSNEYADDFGEVKEIGRAVSAIRTADQTQIARFWNGNTPVSWNRAARVVSAERHLTLSENARLFALVNVAMADAVITCWEAKYHYVFWRPVTAIRLADTDGNPDTAVDAAWTSLIPTPAHPEYPSGHSTVSGAAATVLADYFGEDSPFTLESEALPGVTRSYTDFGSAADEANDSRVYGGIHFRSACRDGRVAGNSVGSYVAANVAQPVNGLRKGQTSRR
jgi:hypothetical protein